MERTVPRMTEQQKAEIASDLANILGTSRLPSRDECRCPCHSGMGAVHIVACCTGLPMRIDLRNEDKPNSIIGGVGWTPPDEIICAQHSTPGLRKNVMTRQAKKEQLLDAYKHLTPAEREELLDKLYPPEIKPA